MTFSARMETGDRLLLRRHRDGQPCVEAEECDEEGERLHRWKDPPGADAGQERGANEVAWDCAQWKSRLECASTSRREFARRSGSNENLNGLLRQYLPKRTSLAGLTQRQCDALAQRLNARPRKRLGYRTPEECFYAR